MLRTNQSHTYTYYRFIQNHFDLHTPSRQPHHRFQFLNSKYTSPFFLIFTYCIKDTNLHGILRNYDPVTQMYIFCPIAKTFNAEESRPFLIPHEFIQPLEIPILEFIHNTKYNHKIYNLIQNTPYEFAVGTEELKTIKALQLLWPLLQTKNIIRILAKSLTTSDMIHDIFPHGFFPRRLTGKYNLKTFLTNKFKLVLTILYSCFFYISSLHTTIICKKQKRKTKNKLVKILLNFINTLHKII